MATTQPWIPGKLAEQYLQSLDAIVGAGGYISTGTHVQTKVVQGEQYRVAHKFDILSGGTAEMLLVSGASKYHMEFDVAADGDVKIEMYSGSTITSNGTEITPLNYDLSSANTSTLSAYYAPEISADGNFLMDAYAFGGNGSNVQASHTSGTLGRAYTVMESETTYMIRITNEAGRDIQVFTEFDYHEA